MDCNSRKPRDKLASEAWRGLHYSLTPSTPPSRFLGLLLLRKAPTHTACQWFLVFSSRSHTSICLRGNHYLDKGISVVMLKGKPLEWRMCLLKGNAGASSYQDDSDCLRRGI
ncbi:hypothetical protein AcW1_008028 [Taiwanofungus camphoratus]|nr:hypothetical protein AcW1_008028 [Antrodia cinnamomea]KAI0955743.1 hypothetical protein AcV7_006322 [Antrodia cinnamomea]